MQCRDVAHMEGRKPAPPAAAARSRVSPSATAQGRAG
uniref:Uncharacterized protein n=1 Tax=Arundo donax TaxID=35708 RepID=A0A0A8XRD2_ARUDO